MICGGDDYDKVIWHEAAGCHGLVGTISLWPLAVHAQQSPVPLIGFLSGRSLADSVELVNAFHRGLAETSHAEGTNVGIECRWANGRYDRLAALAAELVDRRVAVIAGVGGGNPGLASKSATSRIPIVFASGGDAIKIGLVASLARPGGNVTGVNLICGALGAKRLELLHEFIPAVSGER